jgi:copper chaperone CopZ
VKEFILKLNGMSCNSCEKLIQKVIDQNNASLKSIDINKGEIIFTSEEEKIEEIKKQLYQKGFSQKTDEERGKFGRVVNYTKDILAGEKTVETESKLINYGLGSLALLTLVGIAGYYFFGQNIPKLNSYVPILILTLISSVLIVFSYYHMKCYRKNMSCTNGMMIGMTVGMMAGFLVGALVGATNGMFLGSIIGVLVGAVLGFDLGRHCGTMGAMEGLMAGLMAGTMGAMLSVMMINDNLLLFLYFLFGICTIILGGLSYMMYREAGSTTSSQIKFGFGRFVLSGAFFAIVLVIIMLIGPRGPVTYI